MKLIGLRSAVDVELPREQGEGPLRWLRISTRGRPAVVMVYCDRGHGSRYSGNIHKDGRLANVVICAECGWVGHVTLKGWNA